MKKRKAESEWYYYSRRESQETKWRNPKKDHASHDSANDEICDREGMNLWHPTQHSWNDRCYHDTCLQPQGWNNVSLGFQDVFDKNSPIWAEPEMESEGGVRISTKAQRGKLQEPLNHKPTFTIHNKSSTYNIQ